MTPPDQYLQATINRHRAISNNQPILLRRIKGILESWPLAQHIESMTLSGSHPKQTALRDSDTDILLSLSPETPVALPTIHDSLQHHLRDYLPQPRNVSLKIHLDEQPIDLVPARRRRNSTHHTLWSLRENTWLQTDPAEQIRHIRASRLTNEILALKIWRHRHALRFSSFLLELTAIKALYPGLRISESFLLLLNFLATEFPAVTLHDPANSNNKISDSLTLREKHQIAHRAALTLTRETWPEIL